MSILTYRIVSKSLFRDFESNDIVDWALKLLDEDITSELIFEIAGLVKPVNPFEADSYIEEILDELNLNSFKKEQIQELQYIFLVKSILLSKDKYNALSKLISYIKCIDENDDENDIIFDFKMLYWAWGDFEYNNYSDYWPSAKKRNIEKLVVKKTKEWLKKNTFNYNGQEKYFR